MERLDSLLDAVRGVRASLPDKRRGLNRHYTMAGIGMAAFSVFFMQCPSFLAHQRALLDGQGRSNSQTLFKMTEIPSDNHIRDIVQAPAIRTPRALGQGLAPPRQDHSPEQQRLHAGREDRVASIDGELAVAQLMRVMPMSA